MYLGNGVLVHQLFNVLRRKTVISRIHLILCMIDPVDASDKFPDSRIDQFLVVADLLCDLRFFSVLDRFHQSPLYERDIPVYPYIYRKVNNKEDYGHQCHTVVYKDRSYLHITVRSRACIHCNQRISGRSRRHHR